MTAINGIDSWFIIVMFNRVLVLKNSSLAQQTVSMRNYEIRNTSRVMTAGSELCKPWPWPWPIEMDDTHDDLPFWKISEQWWFLERSITRGFFFVFMQLNMFTHTDDLGICTDSLAMSSSKPYQQLGYTKGLGVWITANSMPAGIREKHSHSTTRWCQNWLWFGFEAHPSIGKDIDNWSIIWVNYNDLTATEPWKS